MTKSPDLRTLARLLIFGAVVLSPLLALVIACLTSLLQGHGDWLLLALPTGRRMGLLLRSLGLSAGVALIDIVLGILIACASWGWARRWAWVRWLPLVLIALPPYIHALAWSASVQQLTVLLDTPQPDGLLLSLWVMAMALLPVGIGLALVSLETVARPLVDAARTRQDDLTVLRRVVLPLAGPLLAAGGGLIFVLSLMDYSVPSLLRRQRLCAGDFRRIQRQQPAGASLPALHAAVGAGRGRAFRRAGTAPPRRTGAGLGRLPLEHTAALAKRLRALPEDRSGTLGSQVLIPLIVLVKLTLSGDGWMGTLDPAVREFGFSFGVAAATALLSLPLGWLAMEFLTHRSHHHATIGWLLFLPVALPAPLVGIGLVALWNHPYLDGVYATAWMPVLAALARFAPLATLVLLAQSQRLDPLLWDAARIFQARDRQTTWHVRLPLLLPGLLAGASLVFALTLGELGATLIVAPPGQSTLTLRIYNYLHYGASDVVAELCLAMLLFTLAAGGLGVLSLAAQSRHTSMPEHL
jgi:iron(III) transport system permease protein